MEALKEFWTLISTPGTELPLSTTIPVLIGIAALTYLIPAFVQWRAYRRENPLPDPRDKLKKSTGSGKSSGAKKNQKKKKK